MKQTIEELKFSIEIEINISENRDQTFNRKTLILPGTRDLIGE